MNRRSVPHKAIVLSAGQGGRLLPLTERTPKCLLHMGGRSLLEWQLRALAEAGVRDAVVVTGFGAEMVESELERHTPPQMRARTIFNPFFQVADNLASCWIARSEISGPCLILNGDTLFEPEIARRLLTAAPAAITVTIDRKAHYDADDMKVRTDGDRLVAIGKTLPVDEVNGESIGFLRFDSVGATSFVAEIERTMRTAKGTALWYLSAINCLAVAGVDVRVASIEGLQWGELDFPADLVRNQAIAAGWVAQGPVEESAVTPAATGSVA